MFNLTWPTGGKLAMIRVPTYSYFTYVVWNLPDLPPYELSTWLSQHVFGDSDGLPMGSLSYEDEQNSIQWGPSFVEDDNWCEQEAIEGVLTLDMSQNELRQAAQPYYTDWNGGKAYIFPNYGNAIVEPGSSWKYNNEGITGSYPDFTVWENNRYWGYREDHIHVEALKGKFHIKVDTRYGYPVEFDEPYSLIWSTGLSGFTPSNFVERYRNMTDFVRTKWRLKYVPKLRTNNFWFASLDAVKGFHPYDLNLVEGILQFSMDDIVPKGTSSSILSILTDAVNSKGGLLSPSGIVYGAQIFANVYLYHKYVASANVSDISSILVGDDKASMLDIVKSIKNIDPEYVPEQENWRLKRVAEIIVHRGHKLLSSYGTDHENLFTELGEARRETRARLRAWPRYYDDMSTAAIICEEFGLSLTAERLVAVVPYEFIAQWFVPIEENIRSIEYNRDRLQMLYKVHNLCLSEKVVIPLDMNFIKAMYGLSAASGQLYFKTYSRRSQREFPPTALDLNLHPSLNLSRVLQGTSLIVSRI
jgi:hypothetical protein